MSNAHLRDRGLSLKAKGLLSMMLSLPDDWSYSYKGLASISKEGVTAIKSAMDELRERGYVVVSKRYPGRDGNGSGKIQYVYDIFETPGLATKAQENQGIGFLGIESLALEDQALENICLYKTTKDKSTEEQSTEEESPNPSRQETFVEQPANAVQEPPYAEVISYLNEVTGASYKPSAEAHRKLIRARFADGYTLDDFKTVIDNKAASWKGTEYEKYLRPSTLFTASHFDNYLNERPRQETYDLSQYSVENWRLVDIMEG